MPASSINSSLLDQVREGFATVARMARHVHIRPDLLPAYADALIPMPQEAVFDTEHHFYADAEGTAAFVLTLDAINFGSGYKEDMAAEGWPVLEDSIYFSVSTRLKARYETDGVISSGLLAEITPEDCARLLELPVSGAVSGEFARLCAANLRELGRIVSEQYGGSYLSFVDSARGSAETMVASLARLRAFDDVHAYRGLRIPILKRAQSTAADLNDAFQKLGLTLFPDIARLTVLADNDVPHVLRTDGLLDYTDSLDRKIAAGAYLESGSEEEVEIRACAGHVVEQLAALRNLPAITIDRILWHRADGNPRYKAGRAHRTKTIFY